MSSAITDFLKRRALEEARGVSRFPGFAMPPDSERGGVWDDGSIQFDGRVLGYMADYYHGEPDNRIDTRGWGEYLYDSADQTGTVIKNLVTLPYEAGKEHHRQNMMGAYEGAPEPDQTSPATWLANAMAIPPALLSAIPHAVKDAYGKLTDPKRTDKSITEGTFDLTSLAPLTNIVGGGVRSGAAGAFGGDLRNTKRAQHGSLQTPFYHGTTHDINPAQGFDTNIGRYSPDSWDGPGPYLTSQSSDAISNYAGMGPDLEARLDRAAEGAGWELDRYTGPDKEKIWQRAKELKDTGAFRTLRYYPGTKLDQMRYASVWDDVVGPNWKDGQTHKLAIHPEKPLVLGETPSLLGPDGQPLRESYFNLERPSVEQLDDGTYVVRSNSDELGRFDTEEAAYDFADSLPSEGTAAPLQDAISDLHNAFGSSIRADAGDLNDLITEWRGMKASTLDRALRSSDAWIEAPDGTPVGMGAVLSHLARETGHDAILRPNAGRVFGGMGLPNDTTHAVLLNPKRARLWDDAEFNPAQKDSGSWLASNSEDAALPGVALAAGAVDDIPFDLPDNPASKTAGAFEFPGDAPAIAAPAIKRADGELFDYSHHDDLPPGNPLNLPPQDYYQSPRAIKPDSDAARIVELSKSRKVQNAVNRAVERALGSDARNAVLNWYNANPLRERFGDLYRGAGSSDDAFRRLMEAAGTTSPMSTVNANIADATRVYELLQKGEMIPRDGTKIGLSGTAARGKGVLSRKKFGQEDGYNIKDAQKTEFFGRSLAGDDSKVVVDSHAMRGLSMATKDPRYMAPYVRYQADHGGYENMYPRDMVESGEMSIKSALEWPKMWLSSPTDATYGAAARPYEKAAEKFGLSPGQAQAAAWYGNADTTGVKTSPKTFVELFEQKVRDNAAATGVDPEKLLAEVINGKATLFSNSEDAALPGLFTVASEGLQQTDGGLAAQAAERQAADLPMDLASRMQRAKDMGFDTDNVLYHGTNQPRIDEFKAGLPTKRYTTFSEHDVTSQGAYFSPSAEDAATYGKNVGAYYINPQQQLKPLSEIPASSRDNSAYLKAYDDMRYILEGAARDVENAPGRRVLDDQGGISTIDVDPDGNWVEQAASDALDWSWFDNPEVVKRMKERGYSTADVYEPNDASGRSVFVADPTRIRSVNAAFDPAFSDSANLLAANAESAAIPGIMTALKEPLYNGELTGIRAIQAKEAVPSRASGHLAGLQDAPYAEKKRYTQTSDLMEAPPELGQDVYTGVGAYATPEGVETNPVKIAEYRGLKGDDLKALGAFAAMNVQDAAPLMANAGIPNTYQTQAMDVPMFGRMPYDAVRALAENPPGGAFAVVDMPDGPRFLGDQLDTGQIMDALKGQGLEPGTPTSQTVSNIYEDFGPAWAQPEGSGAVTRGMLESIDGAQPYVQQALESHQMRGNALLQNLRDKSIADRLGLPQREDVYTLRKIFARDGFEGVRQALARGEKLPSNEAVAGVIGLLMSADDYSEEGVGIDAEALSP